ncbi:hypothetical protein FA95DRAFT_1537130 [Auriscalpium vulgare]|uniref:Uncharacterized protein n=1 Tax=Auriscalpium vulgare TaxID=40419 RepID=A0ACB8S0H4_9AGAM|nr:hypothetical protein FA95DRAFT_1537130 [Auriscalpium vulgare]
MSIPPSLRAAGRSVYRDLWRAAGTTFTGDDELICALAFRKKMRTDAENQRAVINEEVYQENLKHGREIAEFLRKNLVQAQRVASQQQAKGVETYKIRITEHSELGDNDTIKDPGPIVIPPRRQRRKDSPLTSATEATPAAVPRFYSQLKKAHKQREIPQLREEDLEESFVRGSGPGGQSINKTQNNVQLLHKPTGLRVSCQETRSLEQNRKLARRILLDKIDKLVNPGLSKSEMQKAKQLERERRRRKKAKKRAKDVADASDAS